MVHASFHTPTPKHHDTCGEHSAHPLPTFDLGHAVVLAAKYVWNLVTGDATLHDAMLGFVGIKPAEICGTLYTVGQILVNLNQGLWLPVGRQSIGVKLRTPASFAPKDAKGLTGGIWPTDANTIN